MIRDDFYEVTRIAWECPDCHEDNYEQDSIEFEDTCVCQHCYSSFDIDEEEE